MPNSLFDERTKFEIKTNVSGTTEGVFGVDFFLFYQRRFAFNNRHTLIKCFSRPGKTAQDQLFMTLFATFLSEA